MFNFIKFLPLIFGRLHCCYPLQSGNWNAPSLYFIILILSWEVINTATLRRQSDWFTTCQVVQKTHIDHLKFIQRKTFVNKYLIFPLHKTSYQKILYIFFTATLSSAAWITVSYVLVIKHTIATKMLSIFKM